MMMVQGAGASSKTERDFNFSMRNTRTHGAGIIPVELGHRYTSNSSLVGLY